MKSMRCINFERVEERYGFTIYREEDRVFDDFTGEYSGIVYVFYNVFNPQDFLLESFRTLEEAQRYILTII